MPSRNAAINCIFVGLLATSPGWAGAQEVPAMDDQEVFAAYAQIRLQYDAAIDAENVDEPWASEMTTKLEQAVLQIDGIENVSVKCRTTLCAIEFTLPPAGRRDRRLINLRDALAEVSNVGLSMLTPQSKPQPNHNYYVVMPREGFAVPEITRPAALDP